MSIRLLQRSCQHLIAELGCKDCLQGTWAVLEALGGAQHLHLPQPRATERQRSMKQLRSIAMSKTDIVCDHNGPCLCRVLLQQQQHGK